ncbi:hypothetical protein F3Y22_tig00117000pilonHSYRG00016 [Hibiscus syriacus]|uniref:Endonuclease/exonuclease/phosphatase domain-containing protein n=1 Tax=Hibiscus syriacus TaxID=106335 RepID=A0A6A2XRB7_HIBSY|nr:hypothetical protein F3Y22_tig00117000pilonHSYRG00016 [Hibiscus syriacus]
MQDFQNGLRDSNLWDLKPKTGWFTWSAGRRAANHIRECTDRFVASPDWIHCFKNCTVSSEGTVTSDHALIEVELLSNHFDNGPGPRNDYFKFEPCWAKEEDCINIIKDTWKDTKGSTLIKMKEVGNRLGQWQKQRRSKARKEEKSLWGENSKNRNGAYN